MSDVGGAADPRQEAVDRAGGRFDARVLEPSPPASAEPPFFADDPIHDGDASGRPVLAPVGLPDAAATWDQLARADGRLAPWCADRWLGAWRRLVLPPDAEALVATRELVAHGG